MKKPFTKEESEICDLILDAHNKFCELESTHPDEARQWLDGIQSIQSVLMNRVIRRDYPEHFPTIS